MLEGNVGYTVKGNKVNLRIDRINNHRNGGHSGSLKVSLIKKFNFYEGGSLSSDSYDLVGEYQAEVIKGNHYRHGISWWVDKLQTGKNSRRCYTMLLEEYQSGEWKIVDWRNFD